MSKLFCCTASLHVFLMSMTSPTEPRIPCASLNSTSIYIWTWRRCMLLCHTKCVNGTLINPPSCSLFSDNGHLDCVRLLLENGAQITRDNDNRLPIDLARGEIAKKIIHTLFLIKPRKHCTLSAGLRRIIPQKDLLITFRISYKLRVVMVCSSLVQPPMVYSSW